MILRAFRPLRPRIILKSKRAEGSPIRIASRPEEGERERHYLRNAEGFDFLPHRLLDLKIFLRTLSMLIPSCHHRRRRRRSV